MPALASRPSKTSSPPTLPQVALKVQRRKYATNAVDELELRQRIGHESADSRLIMECAEVFMHDQHICQVYELHGRDTKYFLERKPFSVADVKTLTRQVLRALKVMHERGLVHSDIKPGNVLWCEEKKEARLIDFGNAAAVLKTGSSIGTREYCPPEMLLGNPMDSAVDLWALGCTVFEWLTGACLFDPWEVCHQKYQEFDSADDDDSDSSTPDEDDVEEEREQLPAGVVLEGKYRLLKEIGRGKCATVWTAELLHDEPLGHPMPVAEDAKSIAKKFRPDKPATKGYNIYEVVMGYEHLLLIQQLLGKLPDDIALNGRFQHLFYDAEGKLRFDSEITSISLRGMLTEKHGFTHDDASEIETFLLGLFQYEPGRRLTVEETLRSAWLAE
ncbi:MAG: protein kinase [Verrucomicrobia bacterium]|nr:protein kinase [Verrucomicrobiota bacterium]